MSRALDRHHARGDDVIAIQRRADFTHGRSVGFLIGVFFTIFVIAVLVALTGCGGGDPEPDESPTPTETPRTTQPVPCAQRPEACL